jgi:thiamine biosynthesis lipoprotein
MTKKTSAYTFQLLILFSLPLIFHACNKNEYIHLQGYAQGTTYSIIYKTNKKQNFEQEINTILKKFDKSLSNYDSTSIISKINRNEAVELDSMFIACFETGQKVAKQTNGAFDMTVGPLIKAYGFFKNDTIFPNETEIDSLLKFVGFQNISIHNKQIIKTDSRIMLDVNAIAQGYSVDVVASFLEKKAILDYMIEIGGEIKTKGLNSKGLDWKIGIDKPIDNSTIENRELQTVIALSGKSLATSGNYRKFYIKDGKRFAHTINPITGKPAENELLSVTVITNTCIYADAYATAFMTMGLNKSIDFIEANNHIDVYFIFTDKNDSIKTLATPGFQQYFIE